MVNRQTDENNIDIRVLRHPEFISGSHCRTQENNKQNVNMDEILNIDANCEMPCLTLQSLPCTCFRDDVCGDLVCGTKFKSARPHVIARRKVSHLIEIIHRSNLADVRWIDCFGGSFKLSRRLKSRNDAKSGNPCQDDVCCDVKDDEKRGNPSPFSLLPSHNFAFTIAEILIVMGIIGIIAQMTIPTLIQNVQEQQTVVSVKKAYSTLSQAYMFAVAENGTPDNWDLVAPYDGTGATNMLNNLLKYLKFTKNCGNGSGCWVNNAYLDFNNNTDVQFELDTRFAKARLIDGSNIAVLVHNPNCENINGPSPTLQTVCGDIWVDINGDKGPNKDGVDLFLFWFSKAGIVPFGTQEEESAYSFNNSCDKSKTTGENGIGCAAWVIYNENMDYLHCSDLSWTGKHKCS